MHPQPKNTDDISRSEKLSIDAAKKTYEEISEILNGNEDYHEDDGLRYFVSSIHSSVTLMDTAEDNSPEQEKASNNIDVKKGFFHLRKNLIDQDVVGPQVVGSLDDQFDISKGLDGFEEKKIVSLGMQPGEMDYEEQQYSWNQGGALSIEVVNVEEGSFFDYVYNKKDLKLDTNAVVLCSSQTADVYLAYLLITQQIEVNDEQADLIKNAIAKGLRMDKSDLQELKKTLQTNELTDLSVFLTAKKKSKNLTSALSADTSSKVEEVLNDFPKDKDIEEIFRLLLEVGYGEKQKIMFLASQLRGSSVEEFSPEMINKMIHSNKGIVERVVVDVLLNGAPQELIEEAFAHILLKGTGDEITRWKAGKYLATNVPKSENCYTAILKFCGKAFGRQKKSHWDLAFNIARFGNYPELNERLQNILFNKTDEGYTYLKALIVNNAENLLGINWMQDLEALLSTEIPEILKDIINKKLSPTEQVVEQVEIDLKKKEDRIKGAFFGFAIGDILGSPIEILTKKQIQEKFGKVTDFVEFEYQTLPLGEHTDDTEMTLLLIEDILEQGNFNLSTYLAKLAKVSEDLTDNVGYDRHYGGGALKVMKRLSMGHDSRLATNNSYANGASIRVLPLAILNLFDPSKKLEENVINCSTPTHNHDEAIDAAKMTAIATEYCLQTDNFDKNKFLDLLEVNISTQKLRDRMKLVRELLESDASFDEAEEKIGASSKATKSVPFAIFCFLKNSESFKKIILGAVDIDGDSDSIAAIAGSFYGALNGYKSLPKEWVEKVNCKDRINKLFE